MYLKVVCSVSLKLVLLSTWFTLTSCNNDQKTGNNDTITVRVASEPDRLNPLLTNSTIALTINPYIFYALADFDPFTMQLKPILIESLPTEKIVEDGNYRGDYIYNYRIREEATWSDGVPITAADYLFTVKAALNPFVNAAGWRGYLSELKQIIIDSKDPKKFSVVAENEYMLAKEVTCTFQILPRHIYDSDYVLDKYNLFQLRTMDDKSDKYPDLIKYADSFSSAKYSRDIVVGSGPYKLINWITKQSIELEKVPNWWGNKYKNVSPDFMNEPDKINFVIIPDEIVALTALKDGQLDIISDISPDQFIALQKDENYKDKLSFKTPALMRYYYIGLNNKNPLLSDRRIRQALMHTIDTRAIIDHVAQGLAEPIVGPFNPNKTYYNNDLKVMEKDLSKAKELISESGWADTNNNGTVDKVIDGKLEEMELDIYITQKETGKKIALLIQESAKKIGIDINLVARDFSLTRNDLKKGNYAMAALVAGQAPTPNDPYQSWHTDNIANGGNNYSGFGNEKSDHLIEKIRTTTDVQQRDKYYKELQVIIYEEQPVIFLYAPVERIIADKTLDFKTSSKRPGFFVNTIKRAS